MRALGQMHDDVDPDPAQSAAPVAVWGDIPEQHTLGGAGRGRWVAQTGDGPVVVFGQSAAQGASDKTRRSGHQNPRHAPVPPAVPAPPPRVSASGNAGNGLNRTAPRNNAAAHPVEHRPGFVVPPKLIFLVTEDWYFWSHRLPMARAARDAGLAVAVATRVREHGDRIR